MKILSVTADSDTGRIVQISFKAATVALTLTAVAAVCLPTGSAGAAGATGRYQNCTAYHEYYPHGVGKTHAHDHTSGTPVTSFKHSTALYNRAMDHNRRLDGDQDGIACEKA